MSDIQVINYEENEPLVGSDLQEVVQPTSAGLRREKKTSLASLRNFHTANVVNGTQELDSVTVKGQTVLARDSGDVRIGTLNGLAWHSENDGTGSGLDADLLDGKHAPTGDIVGSSDIQTLTNKTLTAPDINGGTVDGVTSLTVANNVDIGDFELRARTLESDVVTGTPPLTVTSTTVVTNLNSDLLDGAQKSIDGTLAGDSDNNIPSEKAVKTYVDNLTKVDTAANWTSINPTLGLGVRGIETDTGYVKIGDGVTAWNNLGYFGRQDQYLHVQDQRALGDLSGTFTAGAWQQRTINTVVHNSIPGASLSSNQITLPAGQYLFCSCAPAYLVDRNVSRLYNITDASDVVCSQNGFASAFGTVETKSKINKIFTITATKIFRLEHYCQTTSASRGFGIEVSPIPAGHETYTDVLIKKIN